MKVDVVIPGVGESITEGTLATWSVADGSAVIEGQAILELETDKTTIDVTAPATGTIDIQVPEGTDVVIDQVVAVIDTEGRAAAAPESPATSGTPESPEATGKPPTPQASEPTVDTAGPGVSEKQRISPAAGAAAAKAGIDPADLKGSGRSGMVTKQDVLDATAPKESAEPPVPKAAPLPPASSGSGETRKPLSRIRKVIAANLRKTRDELVLLTTFNEADMSAIKSMRARYGEAFLERHGVKLGFMSFFLKASATALKVYPEVNARIEGDEVVYPDGVHVSVAVSTPKGLVTPVVRHVEEMSFADIERQIIGFSRKAADKTLLPEDLAGGSFTVTNGGIFGSMMSTPLPAPGQSAILGMHAINDRPMAVDGEVQIRPMMYLALSYDHRLVDGREAVGCLKAIKDALEHPERLLLDL